MLISLLQTSSTFLIVVTTIYGYKHTAKKFLSIDFNASLPYASHMLRKLILWSFLRFSFFFNYTPRKENENPSNYFHLSSFLRSLQHTNMFHYCLAWEYNISCRIQIKPNQPNTLLPPSTYSFIIYFLWQIVPWDFIKIFIMLGKLLCLEPATPNIQPTPNTFFFFLFHIIISTK